MSLYSSNITVFNYDYKQKRFFSTFITNVECQFELSIERLQDYNVGSDKCLAFIKFVEYNEYKITENGKQFIEPVAWRSSLSKSDFFTFQTDKDFFCIGGVDTTPSSFEELKNNNPNKVFLINGYNEFTSILPHWELYGG